MIKKIPEIFLLAALLLFLPSCGLIDFVLPSETIDIPLNAEPERAGDSEYTMPSMLIQETHTEQIGDDVSENYADFLTNGYTSVGFLPGLKADEAESRLKRAGIDYIVEKKASPAKSGVVCSIEYAGFLSSGKHYINPAKQVKLCVSAEKPALPASTVENTVYITFDDGPTEEGTAEILDILDTYGIKGTFFLVGNSVEKAPDAALEIYSRGHAVACHSMSHDYSYIYAKADNLMGEVDEWVTVMENIGVDFSTIPKLFRYPGGSSSQYFNESERDEMNAMLSERGFRAYDWNIVANDALLFQCPEGITAYEYIKNTFKETWAAAKKSSAPKILLLHETVQETRVVLPWMIEFLIEEGCTFAPLSAMPEWWTFADE